MSKWLSYSVWMLLALVLAMPVMATDPPKREPDYAQLEDYRQQKAFDYKRPEEKQLTVWQRFLDWLGMLEPEVEQPEIDAPDVDMDPDSFSWVRYVPYVLIAILLGLLIFWGIDYKSLFYRDRKHEAPAFEEMPEDLDAIHFDKQIADARQRQDFRLLVRLYYLQYLKTLADTGKIKWRPEKTNREYLYEITDPHLRERFRHLVKLFEYVWYGDFPATAAMASEMQHAADPSANPNPVSA